MKNASCHRQGNGEKIMEREKTKKVLCKILAVMMALAVCVVSVSPVESQAAARPSLKVTARGKKSVTIKIKKKGKVSGYQIWIAKSKRGKYTQVGATKVLKYKVGGLAKEKKYYIKVRSFRTVGYRISYGKYSKPVKVKTYSKYHKKKKNNKDKDKDKDKDKETDTTTGSAIDVEE